MVKTRHKRTVDPLVQDIAGITFFALGAVLFVGIVAPHTGMFGKTLGLALKSLAGLGAVAVPVFLMFLGGLMLIGGSQPARKSRVLGFVLLFIVFVTWSQFAHTPQIKEFSASGKEFLPEVQLGGGVIGFAFAFALEWVFGRLSSYILLTAAAVTGVLLVTGVTVAGMVEGASLRLRPLFARRPRVRGLEEKKRAVKTLRRADEAPAEEKKEKVEILSAIRRKIMPEGGKPSPTVVVHSAKPREEAPPKRPPVQANDSDYQLPPLNILKDPPPPPKRAEEELSFKIKKIEQTLEEFNIEADVVEVAHGPTVTRYEIQLAPGIKVNKIVSLADNLAMALAAIDVRVEAPIPGKSAIGVEVPNNNPAVVTLREVIDTNQFWNAKSKLTFALGKDVAGEPKYADLTKMPHMLVAGSTNSGKSVGLNSLICSILYRATPSEVKFVLIDPKRVELAMFEGIPHLCTPVVKDTRQAAGILRSVLKEMEHRYDEFVKMSVRNFEGYNQKVKPEDKMPYIVVVIDELADLMMQAGPEVEFSICRLAQLARATGIHLVIATQRPSVDVVTGTIKANISSRIAFAVGSQIDSRTILDMAGAERLIGRGDMLFKPIDASKPLRVQGCFITDKETEDLVSYLKSQDSPDYTMEPAQIGEAGSGGGGADDASSDEMYEPAVRLVVTSGYASTSMLQRRFKIGYTRAARIVDVMEEQGIVGPLDGAKPREVLIGKGDIDRIFGKQLFGDDHEESFEEEDEE